MTIKLYEQEGYQTTFHAHVVSCIKKNELYDIILDQTLFFPEEGGQTCDKGTLNGIEVVDVQIINDEIHHYMHSALNGDVQGIIDLYFEDKNGDIILVDYKTDKCTSEAEQLAVAKKYEKQLILYARAMEKILKKSVKDKYLYLFSPQSVVKLD